VSTNLKIVETSGSVYSISMVSPKTSALMLSFLTVALHELGTRKSYIFGKGLLYNQKNIHSMKFDRLRRTDAK